MNRDASTAPEALRRVADEHPDLLAVVDEVDSWTYAELEGLVTTVAANLHGMGVRRGDRVALWAPNSSRWICVAFAVYSLGAQLVPLNTRYRGHEAWSIIERARPRILFVDDGFLDAGYIDLLIAAANSAGAGSGDGWPDPLEAIADIGIDAAVPDCTGSDVRQSHGGRALLTWADLVRVPTVEDTLHARACSATVSPDDVMQVMFTSGTTGRPKGVLHEHGQVLRLYHDYTRGLGLRPADRYLAINPFFHGFGLFGAMLTCVIARATIFPVARFDAARALDLIERERITGVPGPPTLYSTLLDEQRRVARDLSSLRTAVTGSTVIPHELVRRMRAELGFEDIITAYGMTECCGCATMCLPNDPDEVIEHTSGRPMPGVELQVSPIGGPDQAGEIQIRGFNVAKRYLDEGGGSVPVADTDGWLHTGDIGYLDERGNLHITDRIGDMFIVGGFNVYPAEIEQHLTQHPAVSEAAVFGVADERLGEVAYAAVVLRHGAAIDIDGLREHCEGGLANFKVPRRLEILSTLPRASTGKVDKAVLAQMMTSEDSAQT